MILSVLRVRRVRATVTARGEVTPAG